MTALGLLLLSVGASGCAAVGASTAVARAEAAIKGAERVKAHELAPYSYWLADSYLRKAKLTEGYSEFKASERFAKQAARFARQCIDEAEQERARQKLREERTRGRAIPAKKKKRRRKKSSSKRRAKTPKRAKPGDRP